MSDMSFINQVREAASNFKSPKIEEAKRIIVRNANEGLKQATVYHNQHVLDWLKHEGFETQVVHDQREGSYIIVKW